MKLALCLMAILGAGLGLAACGPEYSGGFTPSQPSASPAVILPEPTTPPDATMPEPTATEASRGPAGELEPGLASLAQPAVDDLALRLDVPPEDIQVISVEAVVWPDTSLGCPAPDMAYAQVLTDGIKVTLEVGGVTYDYHGRSPGDVFLCGPKGPVPVSEGTEPEARSAGASPEEEAMVMLVVTDMAGRLGIDASEIEVESVEETVWRSSALGCEQPGQMYLQVITPGYTIVLSAGGTRYEYHTDTQGNFVLCQ